MSRGFVCPYILDPNRNPLLRNVTIQKYFDRVLHLNFQTSLVHVGLHGSQAHGANGLALGLVNVTDDGGFDAIRTDILTARPTGFLLSGEVCVAACRTISLKGSTPFCFFE